MVKFVPDLFHNRSATRDFLVSHTDDIIHEGEPGPHPAALTADLPDLLDRQGLEKAIETQMASATSLGVIAIHIEPPLTEKSSSEESINDQQETMVADPIVSIVTHPSAGKGIWGRMGPDRFACAMAGLNEKDAQALAETLLQSGKKTGNIDITIGMSVYPTLHYTRRQTLENAEKALDHSAFFGPGTITLFDAVSLNISGDRRYQTGDIEGAIDEFKNGLLIDPANANLHNSLGVCYGVLEDYDRALAAFEKAHGLSEDVMAIYNKGYILLLKGENGQALTCLLEANAREPDVFEVVFHIGQIYMEMDQAGNARPFLEAASRANNRSGAAFRNLGTCLDKLGLTKEAIQAYKSAVKINPEDTLSLSTLGRLYTKRKESLDVAVVLCQQSVRLDPDNGHYRHRLGEAYLSQGKLEDALSSFEAAVKCGHDSHSRVEETQDRLLAAKAS
ncbi:tetratricopeptide repeat domain protein [Desulfosarcina variabilis str. Montpellier]|uniref:tetratricopeptide repeat protein n=1 Tax=Desulfosarcina variabilis TaxID=2300 RepID=UPI003AFB5317